MTVLDPQTTLFRIYRLDQAPLHFSRSGAGRFDSPTSGYGVLYAALDWHVAFVETFGRDLAYRLVTGAELATRGLAEIQFHRPLTLVDLTGAGLAALGVDARLVSGTYEIARQWSAAFWAHPAHPDGLLWRSRFDPARFAVAIFDRASEAITVEIHGHLAQTRHRGLLGAILDTYQFGYLEN